MKSDRFEYGLQLCKMEKTFPNEQVMLAGFDARHTLAEYQNVLITNKHVAPQPQM